MAEDTSTPITYPVSFRLTLMEKAELDRLVEYFAEHVPWGHYSQSDIIRLAIHTLHEQQVKKTLQPKTKRQSKGK